MSGRWKDGRRHSDPGCVYLLTHTMLLMGIDVTAAQKWTAENQISIQQIVERIKFTLLTKSCHADWFSLKQFMANV